MEKYFFIDSFFSSTPIQWNNNSLPREETKQQWRRWWNHRNLTLLLRHLATTPQPATVQPSIQRRRLSTTLLGKPFSTRRPSTTLLNLQSTLRNLVFLKSVPLLLLIFNKPWWEPRFLLLFVSREIEITGKENNI